MSTEELQKEARDLILSDNSPFGLTKLDLTPDPDIKFKIYSEFLIILNMSKFPITIKYFDIVKMNPDEDSLKHGQSSYFGFKNTLNLLANTVIPPNRQLVFFFISRIMQQNININSIFSVVFKSVESPRTIWIPFYVPDKTPNISLYKKMFNAQQSDGKYKAIFKINFTEDQHEIKHLLNNEPVYHDTYKNPHTLPNTASLTKYVYENMTLFGLTPNNFQLFSDYKISIEACASTLIISNNHPEYDILIKSLHIIKLIQNDLFDKTPLDNEQFLDNDKWYESMNKVSSSIIPPNYRIYVSFPPPYLSKDLDNASRTIYACKVSYSLRINNVTKEDYNYIYFPFYAYQMDPMYISEFESMTKAQIKSQRYTAIYTNDNINLSKFLHK